MHLFSHVRLSLGVTLILLTAFPWTTDSLAQEPGDLGIFLDQGGTVTATTTVPFAVVDLWIVAFSPPGGVEALDLAILFPPEINVLGLEAIDPGICVGISCGPFPCFSCGLGSCHQGDGPVVLLRFTVLQMVEADDMALCLTGSDLSPVVPAVPTYTNCSGEVRTFGVAENGEGRYPNGCAVLNPTQEPPIPTLDRTWGVVKSAYH